MTHQEFLSSIKPPSGYTLMGTAVRTFEPRKSNRFAMMAPDALSVCVCIYISGSRKRVYSETYAEWTSTGWRSRAINPGPLVVEGDLLPMASELDNEFIGDFVFRDMIDEIESEYAAKSEHSA